MHAVAAPPDDAVGIFDAITRAKRAPHDGGLDTCRAQVLLGYDRYTHAAPTVNGLPTVPLTAEQRGALLHAYESGTVPMNELRERLLKRVRTALCPYCGIGESTTLDHYLPRVDFPEYAIFPKNLVPCCSQCNLTKGKRVVDADTGARCFLHPYFDALPTAALLSVGISLLPDLIQLNFRINAPSYVPAEVTEHLDRHFKCLGLRSRYRLMGLHYLREQRGRYRRFHVEGGCSRVVEELRHEVTNLTGIYGANHWRVALCGELAGHTEFCDGGFSVLDKL